MATFQQDGSILTAEGRILFGDDPVTLRQLCEVEALLCPRQRTAFPSRGGSAGGRGPQGASGPAGFSGETGPQGPGGDGGAGAAIYGTRIFNAAPSDNEALFSTQAAFPFARIRVPMSRPGEFRRFTVNVPTNTLNDSLTWTLLIEGVATAMTVTYAAGETGIKSIDIPVAVGVSERISFRATTAASSGTASGSGNVEYIPA